SPRFSGCVPRRPCVRVVVRIGGLLTRPEILRHVLEIHADAGPRRGAPAHGVDQDIGGLEVDGGPGMTRLPALEPGQRLFSLRGACGAWCAAPPAPPCSPSSSRCWRRSATPLRSPPAPHPPARAPPAPAPSPPGAGGGAARHPSEREIRCEVHEARTARRAPM